MSFENIVSEAEENLRLIRDYMERSKRYANFAGFSGVCGGVAAILGAFAQRLYVLGLPPAQRPLAFAVNWLAVIAVALGADFIFTRRRANLVERGVLARLARHMAAAALPGLAMGAVITVCFLHLGLQDQLYPYWMLSYGVAIAGVAVSAPREVRLLSWAFLSFGSLSLILQSFDLAHMVRAQFGLAMFILSFGLIHIAYGIAVGIREGW